MASVFKQTARVGIEWVALLTFINELVISTSPEQRMVLNFLILVIVPFKLVLTVFILKGRCLFAFDFERGSRRAAQAPFSQHVQNICTYLVRCGKPESSVSCDQLP